MNQDAKIVFGDFQTPPILAQQVCGFLARRGMVPGIVLESTCGVGSFLVAAAELFSEARLFGWDINAQYVEAAQNALTAVGASARATLAARDFFQQNLAQELGDLKGDLLILGNFPWVTNATVSCRNGANVPAKQNFQGLRGIAARTGKSNFDISEWMLIQLLNCLRGRKAAIAMLCKTATARKLLRFGWQNDGRIAQASLHRIDAKKHFAAAVDACLLFIQTGESGPAEAAVFGTLEANEPSKIVGLAGQDLVSDVLAYRKLRHLEGLCPYQWRSGVKHDCSSVMEFQLNGCGGLRNKLGEEIDVEVDYLFPLLKCSDLANGRTQPRRFVLVTQRRVGEDTSAICDKAPRTWKYLKSHDERFAERKSSIYSHGMPFAPSHACASFHRSYLRMRNVRSLWNCCNGSISALLLRKRD